MSTSDQAQLMPEVRAEPLSPLDRFWLDTARSVAKESIGAQEEAAKQLIALTSLAQGIYFAAISFAEVKKSLGQFGVTQQWLITGALVLPLLFWVASLVFAIRVFKPKTYATRLDSPELARETYLEIVSYKHAQLQWAHRLLVVGFVLLIVNIVLFWRL